jgi:hypothetical protein
MPQSVYYSHSQMMKLPDGTAMDVIGVIVYTGAFFRECYNYQK